MTLQVDTHPGVEIQYNGYELFRTIDNPIAQTFAPQIVILGQEGVRIFHDRPPQPYVEGSWGDTDVAKVIESYIQTLRTDVSRKTVHINTPTTKKTIEKKPYLCPIKKWIKKLFKR
jgi:hypothetical protein